MKITWQIDAGIIESVESVCIDVAAKYRILAQRLRPQEIQVDGVGIGAAIVDRLVGLGLPAVASYRNCRATRGAL